MSMPNDLTFFISDFEPSLPFLPLIHNTDAFHFKKHILEKSLLEPRFCDIFNEDLIYFFYGRPAYRVNSGKKSNFSASYPVAILLESHAVRYAKRVIVFDSGAYANHLFDDYMYDEFTIDSFLVDPEPDSQGCIPIPDVPAQIVSAFFKNNSNYYYANKFRLFEDNDLEFTCFEAECYYELIRTKAESMFDDRRSSIEIQTIESVPLSKDTIKAVVIPHSSLGNKSIQNTIIEKWEAKPITYPSYRSEPDFLVPIIVDTIRRFFIEEGWLE